MNHFKVQEATAKLASTSAEFIELFSRGDASIKIYKPEKVDKQKPHDRDEVYVIISGNGQFRCAEEVYDFVPGDLFFVPKSVEHRFFDFTNDFSTWVIFF